MIYLKTTETCQLNCKHCFTNGTNGRKIYFDPDATIDWFKRMHEVAPNMQGGNITFHGGEPFLAPVEDMRKVWLASKDLWPTIWWTVTTNLVFKLTDEIRDFMKEALSQGISTSWDKNMRFDNPKQEELWRKNVDTLVADGHNITLNISINRDIVNMDPKELINFIKDLRVNWVHFERITPNGNANLNQDIFPTNEELDAWILRLWNTSIEMESHKYFGNLLFDSVLTSFVNTTHSGCRCRSCEQKIFTLNADGTIGGCPNSAVDSTFGFITDDIAELLMSEGRLENIACESQRNPNCYSCEVFDICNGDCHQLAWQGNVCAAPKSLMKTLKADNDLELYKTVLNGFVGEE
jgi:radical SAM protein with 4Fe4S-binding SPASM domain